MKFVGPVHEGEPVPRNQVLVVEDEVIIRMHLADELRQAGFEVLEASNADDAQLLLTTFNTIGLLITDIQMPGSMDGVALAKWTRQESPNIRIAVVSANADLAEVADVAMQKPFDISKVIAEVRRLLSGEEHGRADGS